MGYPSDNLADALTALVTDTGTASTSLGTISAGTDVLVSNFAGLKSLVDNLSALATVLKDQKFYTPVGSIMPFAGASAESPAGWLLCLGSAGTAVTSSAYPDLFNVLTAGGTVYPHGGSGSTTYTPDLRGKTIMGVQSGTYELGASGGGSTTLSGSQLPAHSHTINHGHSLTSTQGAYQAAGNSPGALLMGNGNGWNVGAAGLPFYVNDFNGSSGNGPGSAASVPTVPPYVITNYIIKV